MKQRNSGFGVIAMILGMVGLLALGAVAMTIQSQQDQKTAQSSSVQADLVQQAEYIRAAIRNCASQMRLRNITADQVLGVATAPINRYPDCRTTNNSGQEAGVCSFDGSIMTSDIGNVFCKATDTYVIDPQSSQYNPKAVNGFGTWKYIKNLGSNGDPDGGAYLQITATDVANKQAILSHLQSKFVANDITAVTANANNPNIQIYVFRTRFPSGNGNNPGGNDDPTTTYEGAPDLGNPH